MLKDVEVICITGKITLRTLKGEGGNVHAHSLAPVLFLE